MTDSSDFPPSLPLSRRFFLRYSLLAAAASLAAPLALARRIEQRTLTFTYPYRREASGALYSGRLLSGGLS